MDCKNNTLTIEQCCKDYTASNIVREIRSGKVSKEYKESEE